MTQKRRHARARTATRRSRWKAAAAPVTLVTCPQCKSRITPHRVCPSCGTYGGREVIVIETARPRKKKES